MCEHNWAFDLEEESIIKSNTSKMVHKQQMLVMYLMKIFTATTKDLTLERKMIQMFVEQSSTSNIVCGKCKVCNQEIGVFLSFPLNESKFSFD